HRRLADPGIVDQNIDRTEPAARRGDDLVDRLVACKVRLDRQQIGGALPLLRRLGELDKTLGRAVDRRDREPLAEQAQHQFPTDAACGPRHDRRTLLLAHCRPLLSLPGCYKRLPPSTGMIVPLTKVIVVASPRMTAATSSGWPIRLSGLLAIRWARCCGVHISVIGVSIKLGTTATTRIVGAKARAKDIVIVCSPALAAA